MKKLLLCLIIIALAKGGDNNTSAAFDIDTHPRAECNATAHLSCIKTSNGYLFYDEALIGIWKLRYQTIITPGNHSINSNFFGHKLIFKPDNTYIEDYSSETSEPKTIHTPQVTIVHECRGKGKVIGIFSVAKNQNSTTFLKITKTGGSALKVVCKNSLGKVHTSKTATSFPLYMGKARIDTILGHYVKVNYSLSNKIGENWSILKTYITMPTGVKVIRVYDFITTSTGTY